MGARHVLASYGMARHFLALAALLVLCLRLLTPSLPCLGLRRDENGQLREFRFQRLPPRSTSNLLGSKNSSRLLQTLHSHSIDHNLKALLSKRLGQGSMGDAIRLAL